MANIDPNAAGSGLGDVSPTANTSTHPKLRKRTKTGCLTCRKRRIKCGEERPTCANCIKSKRQCEGYNQRVVFKPPIGDWPNHPGVVTSLQFHSSMLPGSRSSGYQTTSPTTQPQDSPLTTIQPRPLSQFEFTTDTVPTMAQQSYGQGQSYQQPLSSPQQQPPLHSPHHQIPTPTSAASYFPQPSPVHATFQGQYPNENTPVYQDSQQYSQNQYQHTPVSFDSHVDRRTSISHGAHEQGYYQQRPRGINHPEEHSSYVSQTDEYPTQFAEPPQQVPHYPGHSQVPLQQPQVAAAGLSQAGTYALPLAVSQADPSHSVFQSAQIPHHDVVPDVKYMHQHAVYEQPVAGSVSQRNQAQIPLSGFAGEDHVSPTQVLDEAAVEQVDDDYWDVLSDEEMQEEVEEDGKDDEAAILSRDFSLIRRIHYENTNELTLRRYDAFIYRGILTQYRAEYVANPLKNPTTARVFAHFIHVTGPSLAIYERNPRNPTSIFEGPTPPSQQNLWTYTLPLKALDHQGLLHAMLALSSLHIAKLQRASATPSYKHYAYSLKRLSRSLGNPKRRLSVATLATSLLLAFYEVMTAEHVKWSTHLVGGAQLLAELNFPRLTQEARRIKAAQTAQQGKFPYEDLDMLIDQKQFDQKLKEDAMVLDESLVSTIIGKKVSYDDFGRVIEEDADAKQERSSGFLGKLDLRTFETIQDLYWFYARQDAYQSMISGNPLITDYRKWSDCPPRAPLGRADALYGTHDHIILLIARIADFTVRDRARKLRQVQADGGQWRPRPGMPGTTMGPPPATDGQPPAPTTPMGPPPHMQSMGPPPKMQDQGHPSNIRPPHGQGQGPPRGVPTAAAMPTFFGMAPSRPPIPLPHSYENPDHHPQRQSPRMPSAPDPRFTDLPAAYDEALADWNSISHAHATIARILASTEAFAPLTPELYPVAPGGNMTPFGPALVHRSYDISALWTLLHLSNILLMRSHPAMPPAAMMAAGVCAQTTQPYAMLIGRISAGMQMPASDDVPLSPFLGAALIETTMALFFAGVQYQAPHQRAWLIKRLLDIDRRTGWASAATIARSCETSWERAAGMGRGPPYERKTRSFDDEGPVVLDPQEEGTRGGPGGSGGSVGGDERRQSADWAYVVQTPRRVRVPWAKNLIGTEEELRSEMERVELGGR